MTALLELMAAPFVACVVLVGIHAYLGMHVIQRKVIFVDLALAQIAALGATFGFLLGMSPHGNGAYLFSLAFAIVGAAIFSLTRMRHERVPQEAIIGITYAVALAMAILVADRAPEGAEHIKETLVGAILWVSWERIGRIAILYLLVGALHVVLWRRFRQISFDPASAYAEGRWVRGWDFLFYVSFALVITSAVAVAGVLMVFSFLVIPAVIASLYTARIGARLAISWSVGVVACLVGLLGSYRFDLPSGPAVVASLGLALIVGALLHEIRVAENRAHATLKIGLSIAGIAAVLLGLSALFAGGKRLQIDHEHHHESADGASEHHEHHGGWKEIEEPCGPDVQCLADRLRERDDAAELLEAQLSSEDALEREEAIDVVEALGVERLNDVLAGAAGSESDAMLRLREVSLLMGVEDPRGVALAVEMLSEEVPPLVRDEAHVLLLDASGQDFGYDPFASDDDNVEARRAWEKWAATTS